MDILITLNFRLAASMVQAAGAVRVYWFWPFHHNGIYHLMLIPATMFLAMGVRTALEHGFES